MLNELQTWWQDATPELRTAVWDGGVALAAFLGGLILGGVVRRTLRGWNFDAIVSSPSSLPPGADAGRGLTPTRAVALLVRLTVWAWAGAWLAGRYGHAEIAETVRPILTRVWALTGMLVGALAVGGLLARRVADSLQDPSHSGVGYRNGTAGSPRNVAGAVSAGVYGLVLLLTLLAAADAFDWPLSRTAAGALWQLTQRLLTIGAALVVAWLGARWAVALSSPVAAVTPEQKAGQYTALALVAGTSVGAVAALLSAGSAVLWLLAVPLAGVALWLARGYLPDVLAGAKLRAGKVGQVYFDGAAWQVSGVGLLMTEVGRAGESNRLRNRQVLEAVHGAAAPARR